MSAGVPSVNWVFLFSSEGLGVQLEFVNVDRELNVTRFETLESQRIEIEAAFGGPLQWERREGFKATQVRVRADIADVADRHRWDEWITWFITTAERFRGSVDKVGGVPRI